MAFKDDLTAIFARVKVQVLLVSGIKRCFTEPDEAAFAQLPSAVLSLGGHLNEIRRPGMWRDLTIPIRIQVIVQKSDSQRAYVVCRDFLADLIDQFDLDVKLGSGIAGVDHCYIAPGDGWQIVTIQGPLATGADYIGAECTYTVRYRAGSQFET